jgi:hypothetical protein
VSNETVTPIATVTAEVIVAAPSGAITLEDDGSPTNEYASESVTPSSQSVTVVCPKSFDNPAPQLTTTFTPSAGVFVTGWISRTDDLAVTAGRKLGNARHVESGQRGREYDLHGHRHRSVRVRSRQPAWLSCSTKNIRSDRDEPVAKERGRHVR